MRNTLILALALAAPALPGVVAAQDTAAVPVSGITIDRIVAIAGKDPILGSEVEVRLAQMAREMQRAGQALPTDPAAIAKLRQETLDQVINEALMVQKAKELKVDIPESDITTRIDRHIESVRKSFSNEAEFRTELKNAGLGTPEEWRKSLIETERRNALQQALIQKLKADGKLPPVPVTDEDVRKYFEQNKDQLTQVPASVTFRQIIIAPQPSAEAKSRTRARAESLLVEIRKGGDFAAVAKRESMDNTKEQGGDLGWHRRGDFVPEFERMMLAMPPGQVSPVFETTYGYHILRVDKIQAGEYKVRHILLRPPIDSADVARARRQADSVATAWRNGADYDTLAAHYHDKAEDKLIPVDYPRDSLPQSYRDAFAGKTAGDITDPFPIQDPGRDSPKFVIAQLTSAKEAHVPNLAEVKEQVRSHLAEERSIERLIQQLRRENYVRVLVSEQESVTS